MEFEQLKKIWDTQNNGPMYVINTKAMNELIYKKKLQASRLTNVTEFLLISVNIIASVIIVMLEVFSKKTTVSMYVLSGWMLITALYVLTNRLRRMNGDNQFDRSVLNDLDYAISLATYQVNLSYIMRWNVLPVGVIISFGLWEENKSVWIAIVTLTFLAIAYYASGWEHGVYVRRKKSLEALRGKVASDTRSEI